MGVLKIKDIESSLQRKGFRLYDDRKHKFFYFYYDGLKTEIRTEISHGEKEIGATLIEKMSRQTKLTKNEFEKLIECSLSEDQYIEILKQQEIVE